MDIKKSDYDGMAKRCVKDGLPKDFVERALGGESKLRMVREQLGMTTGQLADLIGVSQPHVSGVERGANKPSLEVLMKIAKALGVRPELLV